MRTIKYTFTIPNDYFIHIIVKIICKFKIWAKFTELGSNVYFLLPKFFATPSF